MHTPSLIIDNIAFVKKGERLAGDLSLHECKRVAEFLGWPIEHSGSTPKEKQGLDDDGVVHFELTGEVNASGQYFLQLGLNASLKCLCQRCLEPMPLVMNMRFVYLIAEVEGEDSDFSPVEEVDDYDLQEPNQAMDLLRLIEDEIIMALPIAPMHDQECTSALMESGEKPNPFAVLKGLLKS